MQNSLNVLEQLIEQFLNGEISANDVELKLKSIHDINFGDSREYAIYTKPLNRKYLEVTGKGILFDLTKSYPPYLDCVICLCKAIENKRDVEYYYEEYMKNNIPKDAVITEKPNDILY